MEKMLEEVNYCKIVEDEFNKPLIMKTDDEEEFKRAKECYICNIQYTEDDIRVRDHCHITGTVKALLSPPL